MIFIIHKGQDIDDEIERVLLNGLLQIAVENNLPKVEFLFKSCNIKYEIKKSTGDSDGK